MKIKVGDEVLAKGPYGRRWLKAKVLWIIAYYDDELTDVRAAELEFRNGARGAYDDEHMKLPEERA